MQGAFDFAFSNKSLTLDAPTPTNNSTNSDAAHEKNGTPASPATALANRVLPVPGAVYLSGFFKKSTTSCSSNLAWSAPATSAKETPVSGTSWNLDFDLPKSIGPPRPPGPPPPPWDRRNKKNRPPKAKIGNNRLPMKPRRPLLASPSETDISTPFIAKMSIRSGSFGTTTEALRPSTAVSCKTPPSLLNLTLSTFPFLTAFRNSLYLH
ncbi:hypothetical protein LXL04_015177 [Taraxacum kok-saghyz]